MKKLILVTIVTLISGSAFGAQIAQCDGLQYGNSGWMGYENEPNNSRLEAVVEEWDADHVAVHAGRGYWWTSLKCPINVNSGMCVSLDPLIPGGSGSIQITDSKVVSVVVNGVYFSCRG